ncbi:MAG: GNAT family N-acetyltransferase [Methanobacteriota archaeon]|nr:MAG: GNAT family N-acetyltransferase [Euryarchaeota archaeon]
MLTGKLVALRAFERDDMKLLHEWQNDEELMRLARSFPDHTISMEAVIARYDKAVKGESFADRDYIIQEKSSGKPIGWGGISIHQWTRRATAGEIGLAIAEKAYRAKGLGTEVVGLGFREEGRVRDSVFFDNRYHDSIVLGLLKDDYERSKKPERSR